MCLYCISCLFEILGGDIQKFAELASTVFCFFFCSECQTTTSNWRKWMTNASFCPML